MAWPISHCSYGLNAVVTSYSFILVFLLLCLLSRRVYFSTMDNARRFGDILPIPFKIVASLQLGVALWYLLVKICWNTYHLNILELLNLSYSSHNYGDVGDRIPTGESATTIPADSKDNQVLITGIWATFRRSLFINIVLFVICKIILYSISEKGDQTKDYILESMFTILCLVSLIFTLMAIFHSTTNPREMGQVRLFTSIKRILTGKINSNTMRTNDILLSDTLVSYSKVINDCGLYAWTLFSSDRPYNPHLEFMVLIIPTVIRMKQCWQEYKQTNKTLHFLNMIKYSTTLGPLFINVLIKVALTSFNRDQKDDAQKDVVLHHLAYLNNWWYVFSTINSVYTYVWDIKMDWGFQAFDTLTTKSSTKVILRPERHLYFKSYLFYYFAMVLDLVLRFLWVLKLFIVHENESAGYAHKVGAFLFGSDALSFGYTLVELLELFRRWIWCFLKMESDWGKLHDSDILIELRPFQTKV